MTKLLHGSLRHKALDERLRAAAHNSAALVHQIDDCSNCETRFGRPNWRRCARNKAQKNSPSDLADYPIFLPTDRKARGIDALDVFETCVKAAAQYLAKRR
jgi:hypothetical protein